MIDLVVLAEECEQLAGDGTGSDSEVGLVAVDRWMLEMGDGELARKGDGLERLEVIMGVETFDGGSVGAGGVNKKTVVVGAYVADTVLCE